MGQLVNKNFTKLNLRTKVVEIFKLQRKNEVFFIVFYQKNTNFNRF